MDSASWSLMLAVTKHLQGVMIVMTTRPMETGKTAFEYGIIMHQHHTNHIVLKNLPEDATGQLMAQVLDIDQVPGDVVSKIFKQSEGNPFMTEQLVTALRENGKNIVCFPLFRFIFFLLLFYFMLFYFCLFVCLFVLFRCFESKEWNSQNEGR
jgi:predicted ATPase